FRRVLFRSDQREHRCRAPLSRRDPADDRHRRIRAGMKDVRAEIGYSERTEKRPYFYANAHEKDFVPLKPAEVTIADARGLDCTLDREGFTLVEHRSAAPDLTDAAAVAEVHRGAVAEAPPPTPGRDEART